VVGNDAETQGQKVTNILNFMVNAGEVEHYAQVLVQLGIPLPQFTLWNVKFTPDIRSSFDIGTSFATTTRAGVFEFGAGASVADPRIQMYIKQDVKVGLNFAWEYEEDHYGVFKLYAMNRWDRDEGITGNEVVIQGKAIDLDEPKNSTNNVVMDLKYGYRGDNYTLMGSIEEIKLSTVSDKVGEAGVANGGNLYNAIDPMFRIHGEYVFEAGLMDFIPYLGFHTRSGYNMDQGYYAGLEWIPEFIPFRVGIRWDTEHYNLSLRARLWFFHLEYTARLAHQQSNEGFEVPNMHVANIRFSF
jgi:hypothetical protein